MPTPDSIFWIFYEKQEGKGKAKGGELKAELRNQKPEFRMKGRRIALFFSSGSWLLASAFRHTLSQMMAIPCPPPMQAVANP